VRAHIQRVTKAELYLDDTLFASISKGMLVLLGIHQSDTLTQIPKLIQKIINLRIFADEVGQMNLDIKNVQGEILLVSQFTLYADTKKGNRPSFIDAAKPEAAIPIYENFVMSLAAALPNKVKTGVFGADMQIHLVNDGPVTVLLEV
jgi:D-tyrosyl-tRNA(Tyr) deacylase